MSEKSTRLLTAVLFILAKKKSVENKRKVHQHRGDCTDFSFIGCGTLQQSKRKMCFCVIHVYSMGISPKHDKQKKTKHITEKLFLIITHINNVQ